MLCSINCSSEIISLWFIDLQPQFMYILVSSRYLELLWFELLYVHSFQQPYFFSSCSICQAKKLYTIAILTYAESSWGRGFKSSHPVHFLLLYNYGIELSSILVIVGQVQQQCIVNPLARSLKDGVWYPWALQFSARSLILYSLFFFYLGIAFLFLLLSLLW